MTSTPASPAPRATRYRAPLEAANIAGLRHAVLGAAIAVVALMGCSKKDNQAQPPELPPAVSDSETQLGKEACQDYIDRVCACAQAKPDNADLKEQCQLAPEKLTTLDMVLRVNRSPKGPEERIRTGNTARRIISSCISGHSKLDSLGCARAR